MFGLGIGGMLIAVGFVAQYLQKKRIQHAKAKPVYRWVAWGLAVGGSAIASPQNNFGAHGITSAGAGVVSVVMLLVIVADLVDKRPDWPAFILVVVVPWFMRATGGAAGAFFDFVLAPAAWLGGSVGSLFG